MKLYKLEGEALRIAKKMAIAREDAFQEMEELEEKKKNVRARAEFVSISGLRDICIELGVDYAVVKNFIKVDLEYLRAFDLVFVALPTAEDLAALEKQTTDPVIN